MTVIIMAVQRACSLQMWSSLIATPKTASRVARRPFSRDIIVMMPEGPEVRTLVDQLQPAVGMRLANFKFLSGRYVRHGRPKGFEDFARTMTPITREDDVRSDGPDVIASLSCKGKFIYLVMDRDPALPEDDFQRSIWFTLGMTGQFASADEIENKPVASNKDRAKSGPRWVMELIDTQTKQPRKIYYRDTRNFGTLRFSLSATELNEKIQSLGSDLLDFENTTEDVFLGALERSTQKRNICKFLMDQRWVGYTHPLFYFN